MNGKIRKAREGLAGEDVFLKEQNRTRSSWFHENVLPEPTDKKRLQKYSIPAYSLILNIRKALSQAVHSTGELGAEIKRKSKEDKMKAEQKVFCFKVVSHISHYNFSNVSEKAEKNA